MQHQDYVVLVDNNNTPLGTMPKLEVHTKNTPLHRGFSVFIFNKKGELLLQQRAKTKKTWPGVWSNSVCGHPGLNEQTLDAAKRHLQYELGIKNADLKIFLPDYRYRFERNGIVENEFCPVMAGTVDERIEPNPEEVEDTKWIKWNEWINEVKTNPGNYSEWCVEETLLLNDNLSFQSFIKK